MKKGAGRSITSPRSFFCLLILFTEHIFAVFRLTRLLSLPLVIASARCRFRLSSRLPAVAPARCRSRVPSLLPAVAPVRHRSYSPSRLSAIAPARRCSGSLLLPTAVTPTRRHTCPPSLLLAIASARERDTFCRKFFLPSYKICEKTKNKRKQMCSVFILKGDCLRFRRKRQKVFYFSEKAKIFLKKL